jgi:uncharacterized protein
VRTLTFFFVLLLSTLAVAAPKFPALTGRVVDDAHVLSASAVKSLDQALADYEHGTSNQVVVVTVTSLQGTSIEDYGYQLGRTWKIGQKDKNNGALLIVAPNEKKVRIEVGYGLEPILTDAASSAIITGIILPEFKQGHMEQGIVDGTHAMLSVLGGESISYPHQPKQSPMSLVQVILMLIVIFCIIVFAARHPFVAAFLLSNGSFRSGGSRNDDDEGGFSGGGGSFGGGGSSGSW